MGTVFTDVVVRNKVDANEVAAGHMRPTQVRSLQVRDVLVDTGATTLCLPRDVITQLGLPLKSRIPVETAAGIIETELFEQAELTIAGRSGTVECLALPDGTQPLLGVIPLELLGLEPDLTERSLRVLPLGGSSSYLRM